MNIGWYTDEWSPGWIHYYTLVIVIFVLFFCLTRKIKLKHLWCGLLPVSWAPCLVPAVLNGDTSPARSVHMAHLEDWVSLSQQLLSSFTAAIYLYDHVSLLSTKYLSFIPKMIFWPWSYNPLKAWVPHPIHQFHVTKWHDAWHCQDPFLSELHHL